MLPYNKELKDEQRTKRQQSTKKPQNNHVPFFTLMIYSFKVSSSLPLFRKMDTSY